MFGLDPFRLLHTDGRYHLTASGAERVCIVSDWRDRWYYGRTGVKLGCSAHIIWATDVLERRPTLTSASKKARGLVAENNGENEVMRPDLILIAEDDEDHVFFLKRALHKGAVLNPVFVVPNGQEAIDYLKGEGKYADRYEYPLPSLLLLDLKMPEKNGFEVLEWIRQQPGLRRLRVVVLTTSDHPGDIDRAYELGANSFMIKPLEKEQFFGLTEAIKGYWLWMSATPQLNDSEVALAHNDGDGFVAAPQRRPEALQKNGGGRGL